MRRDEALRIILKNLSGDYLVFSTTGMISREIFFIKDRPENFYMLGSMGLVTPLALGVALSKPRKKIIAIEGDGSMFLNLGSLTMVAAEKPSNFWHLVLDNESYESTGGQPSLSEQIDLSHLAKAAGYRHVKKIDSNSSFENEWRKFLKKSGPNFLLVKIKTSRVQEVSRVTFSPEEIKERFRKTL